MLLVLLALINNATQISSLLIHNVQYWISEKVMLYYVQLTSEFLHHRVSKTSRQVNDQISTQIQ